MRSEATCVASVSARMLLVAVLAAMLAGAACSSGPAAPDDAGYVNELIAERANKDRSFREDPDTPIPSDIQDTLIPL